MTPSLNRKLVLEDVVRVSDGAGGYTQAWIALGDVWAEVKAGSGREKFGGGVTVASVPHRIIVRAAPVGSPSRPKPEQRFREGDRIFRILAVSEQDRAARFLTCFTTEELAG